MKPIETRPLRALDADEKERRRLQILQAAEQLITEDRNRLPNVAQVAAAAGLAKGTVYLYFQSKEELLLSLHELHSQRFFDELGVVLDREHVDFEAILDVTQRTILSVPAFMPLAGICLSTLQNTISDEKQTEYHRRSETWLAEAGEKLEKHYPQLPAGEGASLLMRCYGLMFGLWQLMQPDCTGQATHRPKQLAMYQQNFFDEISIALRAMWTGHLGGR
ncbi:MAG: TetR family transcriptional regulator [Gammaproteobacteria bacterium]|nr:TetR family transcriptional regulator [Gammaproteobacteria bacterium]